MRHSLRNLTLAASCILAAVLVTAVGVSQAATLTSPPTVNATSWTNVNVPSASTTTSNSLNGVTCATASFCVAVGSQTTATGGTLIEQWNGTAWSIVTSPNQPSTTNDVLNAVSCAGPSFCMAVGSTNSGTLTATWNGTTWTVVPSPNPAGSTQTPLDSVSCLSATSCVAVGSAHLATSTVTLVEQWNGTAWTLVSSPNPTTSNASVLIGVTCVSGSFCTAVGSATQGTSTVTLAESWNGSVWSIVSTPNVVVAAGSSDVLNSVSCAGASFCEAVGSAADGVHVSQTLVETWTGSSWAITSSPSSSATQANVLNGVDCFSQTTCSAVGTIGSGASASSLALAWNGSTWALVSSPNPSPGTSTSVLGVTCLTDWSCVAVGAYQPVSAVNNPFVMSAPIARSGYRFVASDGGIFNYGTGAPFLGSMGGTRLNAPIVGMAVMPAGDGYYLVASDGGVFTFGSAQFYGSTGSLHLNKPIVGMAVTPDGGGYWLVASDGGIFSYGDAAFYGSTGGLTLNKPVVGMAATPDGKGYWLVASDGGIFSYGDAAFYGSTGSIALNKPVVGMAAPLTGGYYLVASDGGIFAFPTTNGPPFYGSTGSMTLNKPIVGMTAVAGGYYLSGSDGGVFTFPTTSGPTFYGSTGSITLNAPIVGIAG